jgi:hypothetical protein
VKKTKQPRGFLLLVVIGVLAVMLALSIGFLSFTRAELNSVAHLRDKEHAADIFQSALNWTIAQIGNDLYDSGSKSFKDGSTGILSNATSVGEGGYHTWYRPYEPGMSAWAHDNWKNYIKPSTEAQWIYMPKEFFPEGGVRGRFAVQVIDANAFININDWLEDCQPSQCQMAHIFADALGEQLIEACRKVRDSADMGAAVANSDLTGATRAPIRYHEAWRVISRTTRYLHWPWKYGQNDQLNAMISPSWITTNRTWLSLFGAEMHSLRPLIVSDGIPLAYNVPNVAFGNVASGAGSGAAVMYFNPVINPSEQTKDYSPPATRFGLHASYGVKDEDVGFKFKSLNGFTCRAHTDPDTGRSPVNINTCYNSGDKLPMDASGGGPAYTLEGVFNVESLRRIIKVGAFFYNNTEVSGDPVNPLFINTVFAADATSLKGAWAKHELLRTKLAFQYQESLVRFLTGSYRHSMKRAFPPFYNPAVDPPAAPADPANPDDDKSDNGDYATVYPIAAGVRHAFAGAANYTKTRFPVGIDTFRTYMKEALEDMGNFGVNPAFNSADVTTTAADGLVRFDKSDVAEIAQGALDKRAASAVYDNIVPGKATLFGLDPLTELYNIGLARDEAGVDAYNPHGFKSDVDANLYDVGSRKPDGSFRTTGIPYGDYTLRPKGRDIAAKTGLDGTAVPPGPYVRAETDDATIKHIPKRQLVFGPDWFSTELCTSSTTFICVINVQLVEEQSIIADPLNPRSVFWNQYGVCLEMGPDIKVETPAARPATDLLKLQEGLGYYRDQRPWKRKSNLNFLYDVPYVSALLDNGTGPVVDGKSVPEPPYPTLVGGAATATPPAPTTAPPYDNPPNGSEQMTMPKYLAPDQLYEFYLPRSKYTNGWSRAPGHVYPPAWCDFRGVKQDATDTRSLPKADDYYKDGVQNKKHVKIRAIWCLNQGM